MADVNPADLTDDELDAVINGEEITPEADADAPDDPTPNPAPEQDPQPDNQDGDNPQPDPEPQGPDGNDSDEADPQDSKPSRRETLRVQSLLKKYGTPQAERKTPENPSKGVDYRNMIDAPDEVIEQLEQASKAAGDTAYQEGLKRAEFFDWKTTLKIEAPQIEGKYEFLNPRDEENFHPAVARSLNDWYLTMSGFDPEGQTVSNTQVGYADFVEGVMELAEEIANAKVSRTQENIRKQAATTGLRPDGSQAPRLNLDKAPEDMTDEELDAVLANVSPRR